MMGLLIILYDVRDPSYQQDRTRNPYGGSPNKRTTNNRGDMAKEVSFLFI